jgi:hypothetical protein
MTVQPTDRAIRIVHADDAPPPPGPATAGMDRRLLHEEGDRWIGWVRVEPGVESGWRGRMRIEFGPGGSEAVEGEPGDFIVVPRQTVHREVVGPDGPTDGFVVRIGPGPQVVNVDGPEDA